ncbi:MHYT domain-containing protein [Brevundimonas bullata]|uniref:MHYT domain-containing protein n=1 Tax=Brevundimonas bullata TaxID=13160 RepID=UPI000E0BC9F5|nr:MHYT domain-containing protein [Brevundimonas bullata]WQE36778.1 MHYT domain-containing protein [Brevundimonas bullata]
MHLHAVSVFDGLSFLVAVFAAWTALDLFQQVRSHQGGARLAWLATAATAMGGGVWSMHFIAMLGFDPGAPVRYDLPLTVASFVLATVGSSLAFLIAAGRADRRRMILAGLVMGAGICAMHYVGMAALRTSATLSYAPALVVLSAVIALFASTAALFAVNQDRSPLWRLTAALVLGLAVAGMHHVAMAALTVTPAQAAATLDPRGAPPLMLAVAVAGVTVLILFLALAVAMVNQRDKLIAIIDAGGVGYWELALPGQDLWLSGRARKYLGLDRGEPFGARDLAKKLKPEDMLRRTETLERALRGDGDYAAEYQIRDSGRWLQVRGRLIRSRSGKPVKLAGVITDVTDRHQAFAALATSEHRQRLLINELNHRVKNTLATIQSIAALTARRATSVEDFMRLFQARLIALSDTHNLLTANGWERARLRDLVLQEFRPYAEDQLRMQGPNVTLESEQALSMGLILHELVTNAAKYGALSNPDAAGGRVDVTWGEVDDDGLIVLDWVESGGPAVTAPTQSGFGSRLIDTSVRGTLRGTATIDYAQDGLHCRLKFQPGAAPKT